MLATKFSWKGAPWTLFFLIALAFICGSETKTLDIAPTESQEQELDSLVRPITSLVTEERGFHRPKPAYTRTTLTVSVYVGTHSERIIGGRVASIEDFPYQVSLQVDKEPMCGGSILNEYVILTAAHCAVSLEEFRVSSQTTVRVGSSLTFKGGAIHRIEKFVPHELYDDSSDVIHHDIALLKLETPMKLSEKIKPISLPRKSPRVGKMGVVTGYGITNDKHEGKDLMAVEIPVISRSKCKSILLKKGEVVSDDMICAGHLTNHKDACTGDSGGPIAIGNVQVGIVSWGVDCGRIGLPGVYTNVAKYKKWILDNIKTLMN